jgi:hypothetical protein
MRARAVRPRTRQLLRVAAWTCAVSTDMRLEAPPWLACRRGRRLLRLKQRHDSGDAVGLGRRALDTAARCSRPVRCSLGGEQPPRAGPHARTRVQIEVPRCNVLLKKQKKIHAGGSRQEALTGSLWVPWLCHDAAPPAPAVRRQPRASADGGARGCGGAARGTEPAGPGASGAPGARRHARRLGLFPEGPRGLAPRSAQGGADACVPGLGQERDCRVRRVARLVPRAPGAAAGHRHCGGGGARGENSRGHACRRACRAPARRQGLQVQRE